MYFFSLLKKIIQLSERVELWKEGPSFFIDRNAAACPATTSFVEPHSSEPRLLDQAIDADCMVII